MSATIVRFFVTAAKGTEPALRDELREHRFRSVRAERGGVHFEGEMLDAARACLWTRVGARVLREVASFDARNEAALYDGVRTVDWGEWLNEQTTLAVKASCRSSFLTHSQFVAQKTKDGIVDTLRDRNGSRPSVDRLDPDVGIAVHLARDHATLYLDVSGASLHERGWRKNAGPAPLRENLAAAVLRLSGWDRKQPLLDPMCGAGTIAIEAACLAQEIAPGLSRTHFGFERWAHHDAALSARVRDLREQARARRRHDSPVVQASDVDPDAVAATRANAIAASVGVITERRDVRDLDPMESGPFVVTNPPYGERIEADAELYEGLTAGLRRMNPRGVALLAGTPAIGWAMGRRPDRFWILYNGPIECRLLLFT